MPIQMYILERISLKEGGEGGWMDPEFRLFELGGFIHAGDALPAGRVDRECFQSVSRAAIAKWVGWPKKVQGVMGGDARASIAEIRWRWRVEAEEFVDEIGGEDLFLGGLVKERSGAGGSNTHVLLSY